MELNKSQVISIPKYYQLKNILLQEIKQGKYSSENKLPSESELMKKYNVSYLPVYQAKFELEKEGWIHSVQGKGCFVNNTAEARNGKEISFKRNNKIVMLFSAGLKSNYYFYDLIIGITEYAQSKDYSVELMCSNGDYDKERELLGKLVMEPPAGLILFPSAYEKSYKHLLHLTKNNVPIVLVEKHLKNYDFDWVGLDNVKSGRKAVKYLIGLGHRKIVYLGRRNINIVSLERLEGYRLALRQKKIKFDKDLIVDISGKGTGLDEENGYMKMKELLRKRKEFTAIFAFNDEVAVGAFRALKEENLRVPDDVSIMGFDDSDKAKYCEVPLTTVRQDIYKSGYYAAKLLFKRIENRKDKVSFKTDVEKKMLGTSIVARNSTKDISK